MLNKSVALVQSGNDMAGLVSRSIVAMTVRMPKWFVRIVSRRYVAGSTLEEAVAVMKKKAKEGACFTIDVLGEEISSMEEANEFLEEYKRVIDAIKENSLDANISIKPTAFGLLLDPVQGMKNIEELVRMAHDHNMFTRLDMEDYRVTDDTIQVVRDMHSKGLTNMGVVLQGRLFRTLEDIKNLEAELGALADYRICKGIYLESEDIAHTDKKAITDATIECMDAMLDAGAYVGIATHDIPIIEAAKASLKSRKMGPGIEDPRANAGKKRDGKGNGYEFQMLLGVRGNIRRKLAQEGHRTRIYIPYGEKWYEYSIRRLKENPTVSIHIVKAFLMPWTNRA